MLLLLACTPPLDATFTPADALDTVGTVSWTTESGGDGWVEFGPDSFYGFRTPVIDGGTDHEVVLAGLPANSTWHWRAVSTVDGVEYASPDATVTTSPSSIDLAELSSTVSQTTASGWVSGGILGGDEAHAVMFDAAGQYSWWRAIESDHITGCARPSRDGTGIYYPSFHSDRAVNDSWLTYSSWDQSVIREYPLDHGHHDFTEVSSDTIAFIHMDVREVEGVSVVGDAVWELNLDTGSTREVFNAWDVLGTPDPKTIDDTGFYTQGIDWTHLNTIDYVEERDAYLLSSRNLARIWLFDRQSGEIYWTLGYGQDFNLTTGSWFEKQHSPELTDGGILVFDNTLSGNWSRVVEYSLDEEAMTAEQVWEYRGNDDAWALMMGDVHRFDDGATLANWGWGGSLALLDAQHKEQWKVNLELAAILTFTDPILHPGGPLP